MSLCTRFSRRILAIGPEILGRDLPDLGHGHCSLSLRRDSRNSCNVWYVTSQTLIACAARWHNEMLILYRHPGYRIFLKSNEYGFYYLLGIMS